MSVSQNLPTRIVGRYRVERLLGEGGMARVLYGVHEELDLPVAIKLLKQEQGSELQTERLRREARAIARLRGSHVVRVLDTGDDPDAGRFIVMEYIDGCTLADIVKSEGPLALSRVVDLASQICEALAEAHAAGIVHRDIKPSNVLIVRGLDGKEVAKVADFGIAKTPFPAQLDLTESSAFLGSPKYMSPEQLLNPQTVDARSDVWSFGVLLFEMLACEGPFLAYTPGALLTAVLNDEPTSLLARRPDAPPELDALVGACLTRDRSARVQTIAAVSEKLHAIARMLPASGGTSTRSRVVTPPQPLEEPTLSPHSAPIAAVSAELGSATPPARRLGWIAAGAAALAALGGFAVAGVTTASGAGTGPRPEASAAVIAEPATVESPRSSLTPAHAAALASVDPAPSTPVREPPVREPSVSSAPVRASALPSSPPTKASGARSSAVSPTPSSAAAHGAVESFVDLGPRK